jgi:hypothetical protein
MSSTNDTYHHLLVQTQLKSILKKSPSPRFDDPKSTIDDDSSSNIILSSNYQVEKNDINESNYACLLNDNLFIEKNLSSVETPLSKLIMISNETDTPLIRTAPPADSSSPTTDDEQQRNRIKAKKNYSRPFVATGTLSSSSDNDEREAKRSMIESKIPLRRSSKQRRPKDMQLDEFMRKYQHQGGIYIPTNEDHGKEEKITTKDPINNNGNNYQR